MKIIKRELLKDFGNTYSKLNPEFREKLLAELSQSMPSLRFDSTFRRYSIDLRWLFFLEDKKFYTFISEINLYFQIAF